MRRPSNVDTLNMQRRMEINARNGLIDRPDN
jgi:hypothetical protein